MTLPEYRGRIGVYEALGFKEVKQEQVSEYKICITFVIDEKNPCYPEIRKIERKLYRKGPPFFPVILLVLISFALLSAFVAILARDGENFDLTKYALAFLLPAFICLTLDVLYTAFYYHLNKKIIEEAPLNKEDITSIVNKIRNK